MSNAGDRPTPGSDPFEHDDAAYLLGALDDAARMAFEAHMPTCAGCSARVAALRPVVGSLATAGDTALRALAAGPLVPPVADRVAEIAALVEKRRRRTRWALGGLAGVAAAAVAVAAIAVTAPSAGPPVAAPSPTVTAPITAPTTAPATTAPATTATVPSTPAPTARQMMPTGTVPIRATAAIAAAPWGSEITIDCRYVGSAPYASGDSYVLEVADRSGRTQQIGSWTLTNRTELQFTGGTALAPDQIGGVNVTLPDGTVILRLAG